MGAISPTSSRRGNCGSGIRRRNNRQSPRRRQARQLPHSCRSDGSRGDELLVAKGSEGSGDIHDLSVFNMKSGQKDLVSPHIVVGNYDIATRGWVYYLADRNETGRRQHALWGYNIRKGSQKLIYESNTGMSFPSSDGTGHVLVSAGDDNAYNIIEINADKGTTRSVVSFNGTGAWYPQCGSKKGRAFSISRRRRDGIPRLFAKSISKQRQRRA